jgi:hypothetical protein
MHHLGTGLDLQATFEGRATHALGKSSESHRKLGETTPGSSCCRSRREYRVHFHISCFHLLYHFLTRADSIAWTAIEEYDGYDHR